MSVRNFIAIVIVVECLFLILFFFKNDFKKISFKPVHEETVVQKEEKESILENVSFYEAVLSSDVTFELSGSVFMSRDLEEQHELYYYDPQIERNLLLGTFSSPFTCIDFVNLDILYLVLREEGRNALAKVKLSEECKLTEIIAFSSQSNYILNKNTIYFISDEKTYVAYDLEKEEKKEVFELEEGAQTVCVVDGGLLYQKDGILFYMSTKTRKVKGITKTEDALSIFNSCIIYQDFNRVQILKYDTWDQIGLCQYNHYQFFETARYIIVIDSEKITWVERDDYQRQSILHFSETSIFEGAVWVSDFIAQVDTTYFVLIPYQKCMNELECEKLFAYEGSFYALEDQKIKPVGDLSKKTIYEDTKEHMKVITRYLTMTKQEVQSTLGRVQINRSSMVDSEETNDKFSNQMSFVWANDRVERIELDESYTIGGAHPGMRFKEIMNAIGEAEVKMITVSDEEKNTEKILYELTYQFDMTELVFRSDYQNGRASVCFVREGE